MALDMIISSCSCMLRTCRQLKVWNVHYLRAKRQIFKGALYKPTHCSYSTDTSGLDRVVSHIQEKSPERIIVMTGAGLSTASGIPDFRSPGTGLYDNLQDYNLPYPEAVFDISYFHRRPEAFFRLAKELYPSGYYQPNLAHYFLQLLNVKGILYQLFTQNIDGLERMAGIPDEILIEAHGSFHTATCTHCRKHYEGSAIKEEIISGTVPKCRKDGCNGVIKPDIVFFGENLPEKFHSSVLRMPVGDLLIIIGTSLEVQPFASIVEAMMPDTMRVLFNREPSGPFRDNPEENDICIEGDIVENVKKFSDLLGWTDELEQVIQNSKNERN